MSSDFKGLEAALLALAIKALKRISIFVSTRRPVVPYVAN